MKKCRYLLLCLCAILGSLFMFTGCGGDPVINDVLISYNGEKTRTMYTYYEFGEELAVMFEMELYAMDSDGKETKILGEDVEVAEEQLAADFVIKYYKGVQELIESTPEGNSYSTTWEEIERLSFKPDVGEYMVTISYKGSNDATLFINIVPGTDPNIYIPKLQVNGIPYANTTQYMLGTESEDISISLTRAGSDVSNLIDESYFITEEVYNTIIGEEKDYSLLKDYWHVKETVSGNFYNGSSAGYLKPGKWYLFCTTKEEGNYKYAVSQFVPINAKHGEFRFNPEAATVTLNFDYNQYITVDQYDEEGNYNGYNYMAVGDVKIEDCNVWIALNEGYASAFTLNGEPCEEFWGQYQIGKVVSKYQSTAINYNKNGQKVTVTIECLPELQSYYKFVGDFEAVCEVQRREVEVPVINYVYEYMHGEVNESGEYEILAQTAAIDNDIDQYTTEYCPIELAQGSSDVTNFVVGDFCRIYTLKDTLNYIWVYNDEEVTAETLTEENGVAENILKHVSYNDTYKKVILTWKREKNTFVDTDFYADLTMSFNYYDTQYGSAYNSYWDEEAEGSKYGLFPLVSGEGEEDGVVYLTIDANLNKFYCGDIEEIDLAIKKGGVDITDIVVKGKGIEFTIPATDQQEDYNTYSPYWKLDFLTGSEYDGAGDYTISIEIKGNPMVNDYSYETTINVPYQTIEYSDYCFKFNVSDGLIPHGIIDGTTLKSLVSYLDEYSGIFTYTAKLRQADPTNPNDREKDTPITILDVETYVFSLENDYDNYSCISIHFEIVPEYTSILKVEDSFYWNWLNVNPETTE